MQIPKHIVGKWLWFFTAVMVLVLIGPVPSAHGFGILYGSSEDLTGGARWDAAARSFKGMDRSLNGGLSYALQGRSVKAFRDRFIWREKPTILQMRRTIQRAFNTWTKVDWNSGLGSDLSFSLDKTTRTSRRVRANVSYGAEIDIFAAKKGSSWRANDPDRQAETYTYARSVSSGITLTSGTLHYDSYAISGADIVINSNWSSVWTLEVFQALLAHEIGHALGLDDVDISAGPNGTFIDDNYDSSDSTATLTNSFSDLIDTANPSASALELFSVANNATGFEAPGVHILMESYLDSYTIKHPYLTNDDFAGRQFLYPYTGPHPASIAGGEVLNLGGSTRVQPLGAIVSAGSLGAIPEPTTALMMLIAAPALLRRRRA